MRQQRRGKIYVFPVELATNLCEVYTITEKAPTRAYSWLNAPTNTFNGQL